MRRKEAIAMSGPDFVKWMEETGLSYTGVQQQLGLGARNTIARYREHGAPLVVALACSAIAAGLGPYSQRLAESRPSMPSIDPEREN